MLFSYSRELLHYLELYRVFDNSVQFNFSGLLPEPRARRGAALPQEDVGEHVGVNHMQKVSRKGGNSNQSGQMPSGSGDPLRGFSRRHFATPFGGVGESCFLSKKVAKWFKRLRLLKAET
jgi:hypothetical protein